MRSPRGSRDAVVFTAIVLAGYVLVRLLGIDEPFAFILTAALALVGWRFVAREAR